MSATWITLTTADLQGQFAQPEWDELTAAALSQGQQDPVAGILADVADDVRGYVSAYGPNVLGEAGTIPATLKQAALDGAKAQLLSRVTALAGRYEREIERLTKSYEAKMDRVAEGKIRIPIPAVASAETTASPTPKFTGRDPTYGRDQQEGI